MLRLALLLLLGLGPSLDGLGLVVVPQDLELASAGRGEQRDSTIGGLALSADGRVLAFASDAGDLADGADGPRSDVFRRDRAAGTTTLVSRRADGGPTARPSLEPALSADGRVLAFTSFAAGLTPDDTGGFGDVFVQDGPGAPLVRISSRPDGSAVAGTSERPGLSGDGRLVVFQSWADDLVPGDDNGRCDIFLHDRETGVTELISATPAGLAGNGDSSHPVISADGSRIAFVSRATDLVPGSPPGQHLFLHDRTSGRTLPLDRAPDGAPADHGPGPLPALALSADGRVVAFVSRATNLVPGLRGAPVPRVHLRDLVSGETLRVDALAQPGGFAGGPSHGPSLSADGRRLAFTTVLSPPFDEVALLERGPGGPSVTRLDLGLAPGDQLGPVLSADGRHLALVTAGDLDLPGAHSGHDAIVVEL